MNKLPLPTFLLLIGYLFASNQLIAQFNPDSLIHIEVLGNSTDSGITGDLGKKHQIFYNPTSDSRNTLLLHLVGSYDNPNSTTYFPILATENGFHVINLMYRNWTAAQSACADSPDVDCYLNFRKEIIEGVDYSAEANVNATNGIHYRLLKLLEYLTLNYPNQNWGQYYSNGSITWNKIMVSGHSQGGGHAAVIGMTEPIQRVLMFASPNDYSDTLNSVASWTGQSHIVADSNYYGFNAYFDDVVDFWQQMEAWNALGLDNLGDTVNVDFQTSPYNGTRQLYTKKTVTSDLTHNIMIRDTQTPADLSGTPVFEPVWKYMLGIEDLNTSSLIDVNPITFRVFPNPCQDLLNIVINRDGDFIIKVYDLTGKMIMTCPNVQSIQMDQLGSGVYFIEYNSEEYPSKKIKVLVE